MAKRQKDLTPLEIAELQIKATQRLLSTVEARDSLVEFARLMMPDPEDPDDSTRSRYLVARHHEVLAAALEAVERGDLPRLIITLPPRHGKSQIASKAFPAWFMGRDPYRQLIVASYSATMAEDFGREVRGYMQTPAYEQIFPSCQLRKGGAASDRIQTEAGGVGAFVGAGGALTGRGADCLLLDDLVKDREEANSPTMREKLWNWFLDVAMTRLMGGMGRVVIIMTRWHEDDLVGRLTDPGNKHYNPEEAKQWKIIAFPALAEKDDIMGREADEPLWPERITFEFLNSQRRLNPRGFAALYQGKPRPDEGNFFKKDWLITYQPHELPKNLRMYCASDHAVSAKQTDDPTCLIPCGVDAEDNIWILPDVWWRHAETDSVVEAMIELMARHKPLVWWAERGHISKAIGPFLRKRMQERHTYCAIDEVVPVQDKQTRAQSIQGRMAMGKVRFPAFAPWWEKATAELLSFPGGKHDDFCLSGDSLILMADLSERRIDDIGIGDMVWTPRGTRRVTAAKMTSISASVYEIELSNGRRLIATGNHPVCLSNGNFVNADELTCMSCLSGYKHAWPDAEHQRQTLWNFLDTVTGVTPNHPTRTIGSISSAPNRAGDSFIAMSGSTPTRKASRKVSTFTTWTKTRSTTIREILKSSLYQFIGRFIYQEDRKPPNTLPASMQSARSLPHGTPAMRVASGIAGTRNKHGKNALRFQPSAFAAGNQISPFSRRSSNTATIHAVRVTVEGVRMLPTRMPVFNLTVEGEHVYVANGILTHNCDSLAYIGLGLGRMASANIPRQGPTNTAPVGSIDWVKASSNAHKRRTALQKAIAGF